MQEALMFGHEGMELGDLLYILLVLPCARLPHPNPHLPPTLLLCTSVYGEGGREAANASPPPRQ